eukprot:387395-Amphidinium_carterae.1
MARPIANYKSKGKVGWTANGCSSWPARKRCSTGSRILRQFFLPALLLVSGPPCLITAFLAA